MKALSVKQPYAGMIAMRIKPIETRTWSTNYRGDLLICSSKVIHPDYKYDYKYLSENYKGILNLFGQALCIVKLVDCRPMVKKDEGFAQCRIYPGAISWLLEDVRIIEPFEVTGHLNLFEVNDNLIKLNNKQCTTQENH